jgi:8-oxo-dGTP pyrophosphatase MutT (NUDIX family)
MNYEQFCNNCGKNGHLFHHCKVPITSFGVIAFRVHNNKYEYLMIRRKDTLGYIDFMRGKYSIFDKAYIMNMIQQMTVFEKEKLLTLEFEDLWKDVWGTEKLSSQYKNEEIISKEKFIQLKSGIVSKSESYSLETLVDETREYGPWHEPEWGFPKGRRNYQEKDYECAVREFSEETGYSPNRMKNVHNILPFEEIFTGSNYKSYKHKYYLMYMPYDYSMTTTKYETSEVSDIAWKTYDQCITSMRPYNLEKIKLISNIHACLLKYKLVYC